MGLEMTDDDGESQKESGQDVELTPEVELALGKVLLPLFVEYLQKKGLLEAAEPRRTPEKWTRGEMTLEEAVDKLAGAQLGHEFRLSRIEDGFRQVAGAIRQLMRIASATDERLDKFEEGAVHTDDRLDELIESQIQLARRLDTLNGRFDKVAEAIETLTQAQTNTDQQIRSLLDLNGATKPKRKTTKTPKKTEGK